MNDLKIQILNQQSKLYDTSLKIHNNPRYRKAWKFIFENSTGNEKILDIGCADGEFSLLILKKGYDYYGLEYEDKAIEESRQKGIKVTKGSFIDKLPFENDYFDILFAGEVIEHTIDDNLWLGELNRILKPSRNTYINCT